MAVVLHGQVLGLILELELVHLPLPLLLLPLLLRALLLWLPLHQLQRRPCSSLQVLQASLVVPWQCLSVCFQTLLEGM